MEPGVVGETAGGVAGAARRMGAGIERSVAGGAREVERRAGGDVRGAGAGEGARPADTAGEPERGGAVSQRLPADDPALAAAAEEGREMKTAFGAMAAPMSEGG